MRYRGILDYGGRSSILLHFKKKVAEKTFWIPRYDFLEFIKIMLFPFTKSDQNGGFLEVFRLYLHEKLFFRAETYVVTTWHIVKCSWKKSAQKKFQVSRYDFLKLKISWKIMIFSYTKNDEKSWFFVIFST